MPRKPRKGSYLERQRTAPFAVRRRCARKNVGEAPVVGRFVLAVLVATAVAAVSAQPSWQADADSMRAKVAFIIETGDRVRDEEPRPVRTSFTDLEVNAYLKVYGPTFLPRGVTDPQLDIGVPGRVIARGIVDLDAVRLSRQRDWLDPMGYMTGSLEFTAAAVVTGSNGIGVVSLESATLAGIQVPKSIVEELLRYYSTTPERPDGLRLDEPIDLPANIQSVFFEAGRATVVQ
jgi:hypothetical protein